MLVAVQPGAFFREPRQFELLASHVLPELARTRLRRLRLWSAGCGAGEEAWSLAMVVEEARLPVEVDIVATDADREALGLAGAAVYRDDQMRRVTAERKRRHFVRGVGPRQGLWRVIAPLRDRVELGELDLAGRWPAGGPAGAPFDAVFCHAPIAQLDPRRAYLLVVRLSEVIAPGGALFLGSTPASPDDIPGLVPCAPSVYRKRRG